MEDFTTNTRYQKIYSRHEGYRGASKLGKDLFDSFIFPILWVEKSINFSNKLIAEKTGLSESTIEKKIRELDRKELIIRDTFTYKHRESDHWRTERTISLHPNIVKMVCRDLKIESEVIREFKKAHSESLVQERREVENPKLNIPPATSVDFIQKKKKGLTWR